ncbi:MAG TPA: hypothetical protein VIK84_00085 [Haloplasmataceae bacterium]
MKLASEIIKWGVIKPFFDNHYKFNSIDIETVNNEMFIFGYILDNKYCYSESDFYDVFHQLLIESIRNKKDILTWSRYDNTHILKMLLSKIKNEEEIYKILRRVGKVSPVYCYKYKNYDIVLNDIIKDSFIFTISDQRNKPRRVTIYNLKNLYQDGLEKVAKNYGLDYYSKLGVEYHIIDKERYYNDNEYKRMVLLSNELDNRVIIDIAKIMLENFKQFAGVYPKTIFTNGSIARSYLLAYKEIRVKDLQFKSLFRKSVYFNELLDYSMRAYHGGKIESYVLGYIKKAKIIDITSAYPYALSNLPKLTNKVQYHLGTTLLNNFYYAFIRCDIIIKDENFIHPVIVKNPINQANISPFGYIENVIITKIEYDYLIENGIEVIVKDYYGIEHINNVYPYKNLVNHLFENRMKYRKTNISVSDMFKTIINSLYGITFELTDIYEEKGDEIIWKGYRAGDFFNPVVASYITAFIRTYLSEVSYNIIKNGGEVYLNMTDSIIYNGDITLDVFSDKKVLGKFEMPTEIRDIIILGAGRYEYKEEFTNKYIIKNRGFSITRKDRSFYSNFNLKGEFRIKTREFVSSFKATTKKFSFRNMGHLLDSDYVINPFNLGGKRVVENYNVDLRKEYTRTRPIKLEKGVI